MCKRVILTDFGTSLDWSIRIWMRFAKFVRRISSISLNFGYIFGLILYLTYTTYLTRRLGAFFNGTKRYKELIEEFNCGLWPEIYRNYNRELRMIAYLKHKVNTTMPKPVI